MTGWTGTPFGIMASYTTPLVHAYAHTHGAEFSCVNLQMGGVPASWVKVPYVLKALEQFDEVLWIDADVVVFRSLENIFADVAENSSLAVVEHHTPCGDVPNFGIWVARKSLAPTLDKVWRESLQKYLNHPWWEQAAFLEQLGYSVAHTEGCTQTRRIAETALLSATTFLDAKWNHHPYDSGKVPEPNFVHVTMYEDRIGEVRRLCAAAT